MLVDPDESISMDNENSRQLIKFLQDNHERKTRKRKNEVHWPEDLKTCKMVMVRVGKKQDKMSMAYTGPHLIVNRADKYFTILMNGKKQRVTVDRLKTAHLLPLGISDSTEEEKKVQLGPQKLKSEITGQQTRPKRRVNMPIRYGNPHLYSIKEDQGN